MKYALVKWVLDNIKETSIISKKELAEAIEEIEMCLDKQTPMQIVTRTICPVCGEVVDGEPFCSSCGQSLKY